MEACLQLYVYNIYNTGFSTNDFYVIGNPNYIFFQKYVVIILSSLNIIKATLLCIPNS